MGVAKAFFAPSMLEAWKLASKELASATGLPYVTVVSAGVDWPASADDIRALDEVADALGVERPSSVASVLFPKRALKIRGTTQDDLEAGLRGYGRARRVGQKFSGWTHTYFERLVGAWYDRQGRRNVIKPARLEAVVTKLNQWKNNAEAAFYIHTDVSSDNFRPLGSPCLQYVQFRAFGHSKLEIVGLYRSHDYAEKFLGNAIGLQRLGQFVADRTAREFVGTTLISLHPFCNVKGTLNNYVNAL